MIRRELYGASRNMATDPTAMRDGLISTLGVGWPSMGGDGAAVTQRDSSYKVDIDTELMTAPPPPPNVRACTLPLLGRIQVLMSVVIVCYSLDILLCCMLLYILRGLY